MGKKIYRIGIIVTFFIFIFAFVISDTLAQETVTAVKCIENPRNQEYPDAELVRCIECDVCGYCFSQPERNLDMPDDWSECAKCLYSDVFDGIVDVDDEENGLDNDDALRNLTLHIQSYDGGVPRPPEAQKGRYYTQLGCFSSNSEDYFDAFAGGTGSGAGGPVSQLLNILFSVAGGLALLYLLYGAFVIMTAEGRPEKIQQGRGVITGSIIGVIFSLSAVLIVNVISNQILRVPGLGDSPVDVSYEDDGNDQVMSVNPQGYEFEIMEIYYSSGTVKCRDSMETIGPKTLDNGQNVIICTPKDGQPFQGSGDREIANIFEDAEIEKILLDGEVRAQ
jgi:hypothetical protein